MGDKPDASTITKAAEHPGVSPSGKTWAPSSAGASGVNVFKKTITPVACWKIEDICFDFNSIFVRKEAVLAFTELQNLRNKIIAKGPAIAGQPALLSLFGHADPVGGDDDNKKLSEARAKIVYSVLTRKIDEWKQGFDTPGKIKALQVKLKKAGHDPGTTNGSITSQTEAAIQSYMEELCPGFKLKDRDFLENGKFAYQGCSSFNPVLVFSEEEADVLNKKENRIDRDIGNQPNRRVLGFFFKPGTTVTDGNWPCRKYPDLQSCQLEFLDDPNFRRSCQKGNHRERGSADIDPADKTKETFVCGFYAMLANLSPCEEYRQYLASIRLQFKKTTFQFQIPYRYEFTGIEWTDAAGWYHRSADLQMFSLYANKIEKIEVNNGHGHVVSGPLEYPTHVVNTHVTVFDRAGETWYRLRAEVVDVSTREILSEGTVEAKHLYDTGGTWVWTGGGGGLKIRRKLSAVAGEKFVDPRTGKLVPAEDLERLEVTSEPGLRDKINDLYQTLSKGEKTIYEMIRTET